MCGTTLAQTIKMFHERVEEYLRSGEAAVSEDSGAWPRDAALRRMLQRLGLLRGSGPTQTNRRRLAALLAVLKQAGEADDALFLRLGPYCDPHAEAAPCRAIPACLRCDLREACAYYRKRPTIKDLPAAQRPRERLLAAGDAALSEAELLAIIIRDGTQQMSALDLARQLFKEYGDLAGLSRASPQELIQNPNLQGIGPAKAAQIRAAMVLAQRYQARPMRPGNPIKGSRQIFESYRARLGNLEEEVFLSLFLDTKNRLILERELFRGGQNSSPVDPRAIFKEAVRHAASAVIFVHNHPSGEPTPSREDERLTERLRDAGGLLGVRVLDHIVIGAERYYSFADAGKL